MSKLWIETGGTAAFIQEIAPSVNYEDKTSDISAWDKYGLRVKDYKYVQYRIKMLVLAITGLDFSTYGNLTDEEKKLAAKWMSAPYILRVPSQYSDEEDRENWLRLIELSEGHNKLSTQGRARIFEEMRQRVSEELRVEAMALEDSQDFFRTCFIDSQAYIACNDPQFKFWLDNTVGEQYENNGFAQKSYYNETLKNDLLSIYNGEYEI